MNEHVDLDAEGLPDEPIAAWWQMEDDSLGVVLVAATAAVTTALGLSLLLGALFDEEERR